MYTHYTHYVNYTSTNCTPFFAFVVYNCMSLLHVFAYPRRRLSIYSVALSFRFVGYARPRQYQNSVAYLHLQHAVHSQLTMIRVVHCCVHCGGRRVEQ